MLPAANTAGSALGAPLPGESDVDCIFSWLLWEVVQQVINNALPLQDLGRLHNPDLLPVDDEHEHAVLLPPTSSPPADNALATPQQPCGPSKTRLHGTSTSALLPPPKSTTPGSTNRQANTQPSGPPSKRQKGLEVCFWYNGGGCTEGDACWRRHKCSGCAGHHSIKDCPRPHPSGDAKVPNSA
ncbi:uncharacterized protein UBRO_20370 [Ustilago bromivora]|uniref:C3H1-type domain-containing protein n=1 Tax=Ustilago bromivora TaxID=307758 RepID=A0A1K0FXD7_9BASI|nr:uncharacterized protein UBRO_20370 [Ustilago bromivora]